MLRRETEADWDKYLAEEVKKECETSYGKVAFLKVEPYSAVSFWRLNSNESNRNEQGEIYVRFETVDTAAKAIAGLNGRYFGGNTITANFISDAIMQAHQ